MPTNVNAAPPTRPPRWRLAACCLLGAWLSLQGATPATASEHRHPPRAVDALLLAQNGGRISEDQAAAIVRDRTGGRVLGVRTRNRGGRLIYEVKVLTRKGRVSVYVVDGASGKIRR